MKPLLMVGTVAAVLGASLGTASTALLADAGTIRISGKEGPPGDKGPQGVRGPKGPQGDVGDAQSDLDDLDSRVSSLEGVDAESELADLDSRASDLETFQSDLCDEMLFSSASILSDLHLAAC